MHNPIKTVVLTGGPCGGKTSVLSLVKSKFENHLESLIVS